MSEHKLTFKQKAKLFFKRNTYAIVVCSCAVVLAVALAATAMFRSKLVNEQNEDVPVGSVDVEESVLPEAEAASTAPVVFNYPVKEYTLGATYSDSQLVYNESLNEWSTHLGIDFIVDGGSDVMACYNGVVDSVEYNSLDGTIVTIDHGDGLKTKYKSLTSDVKVSVGEKVTGGQVIGTASNSSSGEANLGSHVHFEAYKDGTAINPMTYLGEK